MITSDELRQKYLDFFESKDHAIIPSFPVIPENDPTLLFINCGVAPLVPYLMGEKHPKGNRLADVQKSIRTIDIEEVGDDTHLTFFEMLGNWSIGDYFKQGAIEYSWEFLTDEKWLGLDPKRIYVTVFNGNEDIARDDDSIGYWKKQFEKVGIEAGICEEDEDAKDDSRIFALGVDNWWGPAGETGPTGPSTEIFYDTRPEEGSLKGTHEQMVDNFRLVEIWNNVLMEFDKKEDGTFEKLAKQNVDTGMGLERTLAVLNGVENVFATDVFVPIIEKIEQLSGKKYNSGSDAEKKAIRIVADHIKAAVIIIGDGVEPSNTERGYVLRRIVRRAVAKGQDVLGISDNFVVEIARVVQGMYKSVYPEIMDEKVLVELVKEEEKFRKTIEDASRESDKWFKLAIENNSKKEVSGDVAFKWFQTYGLPLEMTEEKANEVGFSVDKDSFYEALKKHQELSRTASAGMFKGGLSDTKEKTTMLHTSAHLMLAGLRNVLGDHVHQKGSNINGERLRFDFSHGEKMTDEERQAVEDFVNGAIEAKIDVVMEEMSLPEAKEKGAEGAFENKYGDQVKVYSIEGYSCEICGGPHVKNTGDIKGKFKISKEKSSSSGVRRIKAVIE
ncbi:MAG: alanine--tRNA ligase [Patescibacteria group bacterium]|nr:alanine--tRNA ligase [Patescibacteria group bacterium]